MKLTPYLSISLSAFVCSVEIVYEKSPTIRLKTSGISSDVKDITVELVAPDKTLVSGIDFKVLKTEEGLEFKVKNSWYDFKDDKHPVNLLLQSIFTNSKPTTNLVTKPITIATIIPTPSITANKDLIYPSTKELIINGTGLQGAESVHLYFHPHVPSENYEIVSKLPLLEDKIILQLKECKTWPAPMQPIKFYVRGVDTGAGPIKQPGDYGVQVAILEPELEKIDFTLSLPETKSKRQKDFEGEEVEIVLDLTKDKESKKSKDANEEAYTSKTAMTTENANSIHYIAIDATADIANAAVATRAPVNFVSTGDDKPVVDTKNNFEGEKTVEETTSKKADSKEDKTEQFVAQIDVAEVEKKSENVKTSKKSSSSNPDSKEDKTDKFVSTVVNTPVMQVEKKSEGEQIGKKTSSSKADSKDEETVQFISTVDEKPDEEVEKKSESEKIGKKSSSSKADSKEEETVQFVSTVNGQSSQRDYLPSSSLLKRSKSKMASENTNQESSDTGEGKEAMRTEPGKTSSIKESFSTEPSEDSSSLSIRLEDTSAVVGLDDTSHAVENELSSSNTKGATYGSSHGKTLDYSNIDMITVVDTINIATSTAAKVSMVDNVAETSTSKMSRTEFFDAEVANVKTKDSLKKNVKEVGEPVEVVVIADSSAGAGSTDEFKAVAVVASKDENEVLSMDGKPVEFVLDESKPMEPEKKKKKSTGIWGLISPGSTRERERE